MKTGIVIGLSMLLLLSSCAKGASDSSPESLPLEEVLGEPCSLLDANDLGEVTKSQWTSKPDGRRCEYESDRGRVTIEVLENFSPADVALAGELADPEQLGEGSVQVVAAWRSTSDLAPASLVIALGTVSVDVRAENGDGLGDAELALAVGNLILGNIEMPDLAVDRWSGDADEEAAVCRDDVMVALEDALGVAFSAETDGERSCRYVAADGGELRAVREMSREGTLEMIDAIEPDTQTVDGETITGKRISVEDRDDAVMLTNPGSAEAEIMIVLSGDELWNMHVSRLPEEALVIAAGATAGW